MAGEAAKSISPSELWEGGRSPFSVSYGKLMMWFFLISDALTFGALLTGLGFFKHKYADIWPASDQVFVHFPFAGDAQLPLLYVALMTFILIVSSVTMVLAVEAGHRMNKKKVIFWLSLTVIGGLFFLFSQVWEWSHFIHGSELGALQLANGQIAHWADVGKQAIILANGTILNAQESAPLIAQATEVFGADLTVSEYGIQLFADFFFFVTGFHGFHVFSGVVINIIILIMVIRGSCQRKGHYELVEKTGLYWHFVDLVWVFVFTFFYLL